MKIDNTDINNIPSEMLREKIAYVPQTVQLFSGSIQDNIIAGLQNVNEAEVIEATKAINAHDFISNLPGGYGAELTEGEETCRAVKDENMARAFLRIHQLLFLMNRLILLMVILKTDLCKLFKKSIMTRL